MDAIKIIYYTLMILSLATFLYRRKKLENKLFLIAGLIVIAICVELIVDYVEWVTGQRPWILFHIYQPIEYLILGLVFFYNMKSNLVGKLIIVSLPIYLLCIVSYYIFNPQYIHTPRFIDFVLESFLLSLWAAIHIMELVNTDEITQHITQMPLFWISFAVLLFYSGSIFIMGFRYYFIVNDKELGEKLMTIPHYLNLIFYLLLTIGFLCTPPMKKSYLV